MYKFAFTLLFVIAAQHAVAGKSLNSVLCHLSPTPRLERCDCRVAAANAGLLASSSRRLGRRKGKMITPELDRKPAGRVLTLRNAGITKTAGKARKAISKRTRREETVLPARAGSKGRAPRSRSSRAAAAVTFMSRESLPIVKGPTRKGQEHYDPSKSENPLLDTSGSNRFVMLSDNFSVDEVARSGNKTFDKARIDPQLVRCLQSIRDLVGKPVFVNSGYRSFWHNNEVYRWMGKKPTNSQHIGGKAADIKIAGMTGLEIAKVAIDACGLSVAIGVGPEYAHVDVRGNPVAWKYRGVTNRQLAAVERHRAARREAQQARARRQRRGNSPKRA